jgi:hypothetical protein
MPAARYTPARSHYVIYPYPPRRKPTRTSAFRTAQQAKGDSHTRQTDKAARYAAEHELVLDTALNPTDLRVSAYRGKNAKTGSLSVFLKAIEDGTVPRGAHRLRTEKPDLSGTLP